MNQRYDSTDLIVQSSRRRSQLTTIFAKRALLQDGWAERVRFRVDDGRISSLETHCSRNLDDFVAGTVVPGIQNAHSHAFQRALAGHCEQRAPADRDNFWTWRVQMYRLAGLIDERALRAIARQAFTEMLVSGYTSVAEFHYLHGERELHNERGFALFHAIANAALDTGIRLTYIPILYERAGFDQSEPTVEQRRFAMREDEFVAHYEYARQNATKNVNVGIGAHSLRAVAEGSLQILAELANRDGCPMHIHVAEQQAEVDQCLARHNARPVEWLLRECAVNDQWCLIHATHITSEELESICKSGAVVCLCPTTEANLGDGLFPLSLSLRQEGRIAIGSDSQISINPFEELRWLEYGQRLMSRTRNVAAIHDPHTGRSLFNHVLEGGRLACGHGAGHLSAGSPADLLVLDDESPVLAGHACDSVLDALVFSGATPPIDRVMVGGEWRVVDGKHVKSQQSTSEFNAVVEDLWISDRLPDDTSPLGVS